MGRPVIGVSCNLRPHEGENGVFNVDRSYTDAIYKAGGIPQIIPILPPNEIEYLVTMYDGILLSGGGGLLPEIKKMAILPGLKEQNPLRYAFEYDLIRMAWRREIPILGICRGHQMINDVKGGTVINLDTKKHRQENVSEEASHSVKVKPDTKLSKVVLKQEVPVNSFHSQVIDQIGDDLKISAYSDDGYIEGIESTDERFVMGVQFHPEFMIENEEMLNIYRDFVNAARHYKEIKSPTKNNSISSNKIL